MAYKKEVQSPSGLMVEGAYWRPTRFAWDAEGKTPTLSIRFSAYLNKESRKEGKPPIGVRGAVKDFDGTDFAEKLKSVKLSQLFSGGVGAEVTLQEAIDRFCYWLSTETKDSVRVKLNPTTNTEVTEKVSFFQDAQSV